MRRPTYIIVGGGWSLHDFNWPVLPSLQKRGARVVAINRALENVPTADVVWWSDWSFYDENRSGILGHRGLLCTLSHKAQPPVSYPDRVVVYRSTGVTGYDPSPGCVRHGNNGGYAALHVVGQNLSEEGGGLVVLLGYDFRYGPSGETHYHSGHVRGGRRIATREASYQSKMLPYFSSLRQPLEDLGVEVVNANPASLLSVWPRVDFGEVRW